MNPLHNLFGISQLFSSFDRYVDERGWSRGNGQLIGRLGIKVKSDLPDFPKRQAVLIYANHPTGLDPYLISSEIEREDMFFLSDVYQTLKGRHIKKHILPVYYWDLLSFIYKPLLSWPGFFIMRLKVGTVSRQSSAKLNKTSLQKAVILLQSKKAVLIFPSGGEASYRSWKKGIGIVLLECARRKIPVKLYKVKISGLSEIKLVIHFLLRRFQNRILEIVIKGKLVSQDKYLKHNDPLQIARDLQIDY